MRISFLGTGSVASVPVYGCACEICTRARGNLDYRRAPNCLLVDTRTELVVIGAGSSELGERLLRRRPTAVLLNSYTPEFMTGLWHLRHGPLGKTPVYGPEPPTTCGRLLEQSPGLRLNSLGIDSTVSLGELRLTALPADPEAVRRAYILSHGGERLAHVPLVGELPNETVRRLTHPPVDLLILDCAESGALAGTGLPRELALAMETATLLTPLRVLLTGISHHFDRWLMHANPPLPSGILVARDRASYAVGDAAPRDGAHLDVNPLPGA